jgi:cysteine desulfurase
LRVLEYSMSSLRFFTGTCGFTISRLPPRPPTRAIGVSDALAHCSLRFGLGRATTADDIDRVASAVAALVAEVRARSI